MKSNSRFARLNPSWGRGIWRTLCLLIVLGCAPAWAQFTTVSGTVTDPNGLPYSYGTIASRIVASGTPVFSSNNQVYIQPTQATGLDINGKFTLTLADNTQLSPGGSTWTFTVCSTQGTVQPAFGKGPVCFTVTGVTISGSSQSLTSTLTAAAVALTANFTSSGGCIPLVSTANGVLFLNGSSACTTAANFLYGDAGLGGTGVPTLQVGSAAGGDALILLRGPDGSINLAIPQAVNTGDVGWLQNNRGLIVGAQTNGNNVAIGQNASLAAQTITTTSRSSNVSTLTFTPYTGGFVFPIGVYIKVAGVTDSSYNCARCKVLSTGNGTLTYSNSGANGSSSGGTVSLFANDSISVSNNFNSQGFLLEAPGGETTGPDGNAWPAISIVVGGNQTQSQTGGDILFAAGWTTDSGADTSEPAGNINLLAGGAVGGNNNGGNVNLSAGGASGTGTAGVINLKSNTVLTGTNLETLGSTTVSALPSAASNPGAVIRVSDSTAVASEGQTCAGSSTNNALAFSNGSVWKCF